MNETCVFQWELRPESGFRCAEGVVYTAAATQPECQCLNIYVPAVYVDGDGSPNPAGRCGRYTAKTAPVLFHNNSGGYMQMPPATPDLLPDVMLPALKRGFVVISCGCRGRGSAVAGGVAWGKSPWPLVDIKTAIRFVRRHAQQLPGDFDHMVCVGVSAGGAMSSLVGVTGDAPEYLPYLEQNGAWMEGTDAVFAAQIYCPIVNMEQADRAYEWQFRGVTDYGASPENPPGSMTPFEAALSGELAAGYVTYFNRVGLLHPKTGERLTLTPNGHGGSGYDLLMEQLEAAAAKHLTLLQQGRLPLKCTVEDYLAGNYTYQRPAPIGPPPGGELPAPGGPVPPMRMVTARGWDKRPWLSWDGMRAHITDLAGCLAGNCPRIKACPAFDALAGTSPANQIYGSASQDTVHFSGVMAQALEALREEFPREYERYYPDYAAGASDPELTKRRALLEPLTFLHPGAKTTPARWFRIRLGTQDAHTAYTVSLELALRLAALGHPVDYALVWDEDHGSADYPGELCDWIEHICAEK